MTCAPSADQTIDFVVMDVAINAAAGALKAFFADLPEPLIPYSLHPELVEAASKRQRHALAASALRSASCSGLTFDPRRCAAFILSCELIF